MATTLKAAVENYLRAKSLARGTRNEYFSTLRKWGQWGGGVPIEELWKDVREFLDWVYEHAIAEEGTNPGRTSNKAREHLRAVLSWAWEQELIDTPPRFPTPREQRDVAGRHYLTKTEINSHALDAKAARLGQPDPGRVLLACRTRPCLMDRFRVSCPPLKVCGQEAQRWYGGTSCPTVSGSWCGISSPHRAEAASGPTTAPPWTAYSGG
jgi:hypothetical protein